MCEVDPQNVGMLRLFGGFLLAAVALSLITGKSYFRYIIVRSESPLDYWISICSFSLLGAFVLIATVVC